MNISLPVYQHPTLTILIDDSQSFLDSLALAWFKNRYFGVTKTSVISPHMNGGFCFLMMVSVRGDGRSGSGLLRLKRSQSE